MNNSKLFSDEAANIYERAIGTLLKKNMLLYFAFADYEEVRLTFQAHGAPSLQETRGLIGAFLSPAALESHEVREGPQHL